MERLLDEMMDLIAQMPLGQRRLFMGFINLVGKRMHEMRSEITELETLLGDATAMMGLLVAKMESGEGPGQQSNQEEEAFKARNPARFGRLLVMN